MGTPGHPSLSSLFPTELPAPVIRLVGRLRRGLKGQPPAHAVGEVGQSATEPLLQAGQRLRDAREAEGLSLRQLAQATRISTPVLEALEKGWRDRLPEAAYLRTMLPLLEERLRLGPGSLDGALPAERRRGPAGWREPRLLRFTPGSIDVFRTWQGTLLYGVIVLLLLYGLNLQQRQLVLRGRLTAQPLPPMAPAAEAAASAEDADALLLDAYPELQPLRRAAQGQALPRLRTETRARPGVDLSLGRLELRLAVPTRLRLTGPDSRDTSLSGVIGQVSLPVQPPFELVLEPPPPTTQVRWRGRPLTPDPRTPGRFRYPPLAEPRPDRGLLPQRAAIAP